MSRVLHGEATHQLRLSFALGKRCLKCRALDSVQRPHASRSAGRTNSKRQPTRQEGKHQKSYVSTDRLRQHIDETPAGRCGKAVKGRGMVFTSVQYCCLVSASMWAKPPKTSAFISVLCTGLDKKFRGGLRLANCLARFHQLSHWITRFALQGEAGRVTSLRCMCPK